jgi:rabenosyn-5
VKWEDDSEVRKCRICLYVPSPSRQWFDINPRSSFSLSNRKHHCRVCGRIVCSLPPTPSTLLAVQIQLFAHEGELPPGTRRDKCSLLLVADWKSGRGEEVEEGFVGWMKIDDSTSGSGTNTNGNGKGEGEVKEVQVRGVRVCKDCWGTVSYVSGRQAVYHSFGGVELMM